MIPIQLSITVLVVSVLTLLYVLYKINKSKLEISDAIFWIITPFILIILSIFPQVTFFFANILGIVSPINLLILIFVAIGMLKLFLLTIKISKLKEQVKTLAQKIAFDEYDKK